MNLKKKLLGIITAYFFILIAFVNVPLLKLLKFAPLNNEILTEVISLVLYS